MSYVEDNLLTDEKIIIKANIHWFIYIPAAVMAIIGVILLTSEESRLFGVIFFLAGIVKGVMSWIYCISTELAVTNKKIIAKFGFIKRNTIELKHGKMESLHVDQGIFGRIFNFGSIVVTGTGGTKAPIPYIAEPLNFRKMALEISDPS